jgi:[protein-PII] uridylyltransferase
MDGGILRGDSLEAFTPAKTQNLDQTDLRRRLTDRLTAARQEFVAEIERGRGGAIAHVRFADRLDDLIRNAVTGASGSGSGTGNAGGPQPGRAVAICALGGYGRRTLCLHSDIDLLIVFDGKLGRAEERFVSAVLHPLWDLKLTIGHQVRTFAEIEEIEDDNPEFLLALLDARRLTGDRSLLDRVMRRVGHARSERRADILDALDRLTASRHASFNDTIYQLEPDVKDAPGGLRDLMATRLLASLAPAATATVVDGARLDQAEDFLLRVRSVLHVETGRDINVLSHELQERAAERLQGTGANTQQRVEGLMSRYFGHARIVSRARARTDKAAQAATSAQMIAASRARAGGATTTAGDSELTVIVPPRPVGPNLEVTDAGIRFIDAADAADDPPSWLHAFEVALDHGVPIADEALTLIERLVHRESTFDEVLPAREDRLHFLSLLRPRAGLYARLSELHECGLLDRLLPGFAAIYCRVIRDFYHKYTVDEHTLLTIRGIERLLSPEPARERYASLLGELRCPERLVLALLFHDVGKWKEENHAAESERMVRALLDRFEVDEEVRHDVEFLIGQHLQMSRLAFRRDSEDPGVVRELATLVGTEERLKMLCLLTLVDIEAVGPGTLTPWKEELLWRLYVDTYNDLTLAYGDVVIERGQAAVAALQARRPADLTERQLAEFLEGFPRRYLALFDAAHVYQHARLARDIHPGEVHLFLEPKGDIDIWELAVVTLDTPRLFANISGTVAYFGMDILRGSAMTSPAGLVLDIFQFADREGFFRLNAGAGATDELRAMLQQVIAGQQDITALLQRKANGPLYRRGPQRVAPVVYFDDTHSQSYTVIELVAQDALGLLHRISRAIAQHDCDVDLVLMSTEGHKAIDVFHLTQDAHKLPKATQLALKADLERLLEEDQ